MFRRISTTEVEISYDYPMIIVEHALLVLSRTSKQGKGKKGKQGTRKEKDDMKNDQKHMMLGLS